MICVIAPFPSRENQKDGMIQRVAAIDSLIAAVPRSYLDISFRRFFKKEIRSHGQATVYCLNAFVHAFLILRLLRSARVVYVHSAYNALKIMAFPTKASIVFDAHGIVPEERLQEGERVAARLYAMAERFILRRCTTLVCVTHAMLRHFHQKHGMTARAEIVLPILPHFGDGATAAQAMAYPRDAEAVIYAGGMQAWQNVDKMVAATAAQPQLRYTFLTGEVERFEASLRRGGARYFVCKAVAPEAVKDTYLTHNYGFVLRDEILVNAVACPTKLVEYMYWGVVPIVITPNIGDFDRESLHGVTLQQFARGELPNAADADAMRRHNQAVVRALIASAQSSRQRLQTELLGTAQTPSRPVAP